MGVRLGNFSRASLGAIAVACSFSLGFWSPAAASAAVDAEAQPSDNSGETAESGTGVGEIVVTARRVAENLQDVPQQVTAVTGEKLSELSITQFENIAAVVPALTLGRDGYGFAAPQIRGVPFDFIASVNPTVDIYLNEVPLQPGPMAYSAFFDVENIQVLEGPQGTARGRTAPSGAILLTSRRPNVDQFGGYISGLAAELEEYNAQGAVNVPVIPGKLALRVAGLYSKSRGDFVRSVNSNVDSGRKEFGLRISALFKPSDDFDALITYQRLDTKSTFFPAVFGNGSPGATYEDGLGNTLPNPFAPPGYNGPAISPFDRLAVADFPSQDDFKYDFVTGQVNANLFGHKLTYIGGYFNFSGFRKVEQDPGNLIIGPYGFQEGPLPSYQITQEVRIASEPGGFLDYTAGYFFSKRVGSSFTSSPIFFYPSFGFFGPPYNPAAFNSNISFPFPTTAPMRQIEHSIFASATFRPGPKTEITLGGRYLIIDNFSGVEIGIPPTRYVKEEKANPFVFSASISHRFTDDLMVYGNVASSHRMGFPNVGVNNTDGDPLIESLLFPRQEKSVSFELGMKSNWLDNRLRINVTAFYQKFDDLLFTTLSVPYKRVTTGAEVGSAQFNTNGDAVAKGFNVDVAFRPSRQFSISAQVAYAKTRLNNALIPCRDLNENGVADGDEGFETDANLSHFTNWYVAQCRSNGVVTRNPLWKATIQSEFSQPLNSSMEGYIRGLLTYNSSNPNRSTNFTADSYTMLTLYAGVRSPNGAWDLGVFLRNATNTQVQLSRGEDDLGQGIIGRDPLGIGDPIAPFGLAGYRSTSVTPPRQFGVSLRYAFGSR